MSADKWVLRRIGDDKNESSPASFLDSVNFLKNFITRNPEKNPEEKRKGGEKEERRGEKEELKGGEGGEKY